MDRPAAYPDRISKTSGFVPVQPILKELLCRSGQGSQSVSWICAPHSCKLPWCGESWRSGAWDPQYSNGAPHHSLMGNMASDPTLTDLSVPEGNPPVSKISWAPFTRLNPLVLATAVLALATGLRLALTSLWGADYIFITYYPAIVVIALASGWRYGIGATLIAAALSAGLLFDETSSLLEQAIALTVFVTANIIIISLAEAVTLARMRAQEEALLARATEARLRRELQVRARAEEAQRASERQIQFVTDHAPVCIAQCGADGWYRFVNQQYGKLFGWKPEEIIGRHPREVLGEAVYAQAVPFIQQVLAGRQIQYDLKLPRAGFAERLLQVTYAPELAESGRVTGFIAAIVDVTERQQAETARATLAAIVNSSDDAIIGKDLYGFITSWNQGAERIFGYSREEAVGQSVTILIPPDRLHEEPPILEKIRRGEVIQHYETVRRCKDGRLRNISLTVSPIKNDEGVIVGVSKVARDITERKRAEEALRESEARHRATFDKAAVGIAHVGLDGRWLRFNDAMCTITGYSREELGAKTFLDITHPDDVDADWSAARRLRNGEIETYFREKRYIRQDGTAVWTHLTVSLQRDAQGRPQNFISIVQDIQSRKEAQAQMLRLAEDLERRVEARTRELAVSQDKLRALTTDLNLAEHRIRQKLATDLHDYLAQLLVLSRIKLGQAKLEEVSPSAAQAMTEVQQVMDQALSYTRTLVAQLSPPVLNEFGLPMALRWLADQMQRELTVTLELETETLLLPEEQSVLLFQSVRELLMNIVKHAATAEAKIVVSQVDGALRITVSDQGAGYELGTTETGLAPGFGLFSIRERMKALGGEFEVHSTPGVGTTATLLLPIVHREVSRAESIGDAWGSSAPKAVAAADALDAGSLHIAPATTFLPPPKVRVLLVDDHLMLRQGLRAIVNRHVRLEVIGEAADGLEAIDLARRLKPDVVVMDVNMPRCDGIAASKRIKEESPHIGIVALSMHDSPEMIERMIQAGASNYLTKESAGEQLCHAIVEAAGHNS